MKYWLLLFFIAPVFSTAMVTKISEIESSQDDSDILFWDYNLTPDGKYLFYPNLGADPATVYRVDLTTSKIKAISHNNDYVGRLSVSNDGNTVAYINSNLKYRIQDLRSTNSIEVDFGGKGCLTRNRVSHSGNYFAFQSCDNKTMPLHVLNLKTGNTLAIEKINYFYEGLAFSEDETRLFVVLAEDFKGVVLNSYDLTTGKLVSSLFQAFPDAKNVYNASNCQISSDGLRFICAVQHDRPDERYDYVFFDITTKSAKFMNVDASGNFLGEGDEAAITPDGATVFYVLEGTIVKQDVISGRITDQIYAPGTTNAPGGSYGRLRISSDGSMVVFASNSKGLIPNDSEDHASMYLWTPLN